MVLGSRQRMKVLQRVQFYWSRTNRWHRILMVLVLAELEWIPGSIKLGFNCNDPSLSHPFTGDTISWKWLISLTFTVPYIIIYIVELVYHSDIKRSKKQAWNWYKEYTYGLLLNLTLLAIVKGIVGEPRPHFFDTCSPKEALTCQGSEYVESYTCTKQHWVAQSNRSFPSGHASMSFQAAAFTVYYLHRRLQSSGMLTLIIRATCVASAVLCSLSRITDRRHHWWDVLTGACIAVPLTFYTVYLCKNFESVNDTWKNASENGKKEKHKSKERLDTNTSL